jgi:hypothetical protein
MTATIKARIPTTIPMIPPVPRDGSPEGLDGELDVLSDGLGENVVTSEECWFVAPSEVVIADVVEINEVCAVFVLELVMVPVCVLVLVDI